MTRAKKYIKDTGGNIAVNFALGLTAVIALVGAAVDLSLINSQKSKLQNLADSTALATAVSGNTDLAALQVFAEDFMKASTLPEANVSVQLNNGNVLVELTKSKDLLISNAFPGGKVDLFADSEVALPGLSNLGDGTNDNSDRNDKTYNVALILDTTSSMIGGKLDVLKEATTWYLTEMEEKGSEDTMFSLVPFSDYVRIPVSNADQPWIEVPTESTETGIFAYSTGSWEGCMNSRRDGFDTKPDFESRRLQAFWEGGRCGVKYNNELMPLSQNFAAAKTEVNSWEHNGSTYLPSGLIWGWRTLSPNAPFTEAATASPDAEKVAILITDGNNTVVAEEEKAHSNGKYHDKTGSFAHISSTANAVTEEICDGMKADGIKIFTITFKVDQEETQEMLLKCATEPGFFYRVDENDKLLGAVQSIAGELNKKEEHVVRLMR